MDIKNLANMLKVNSSLERLDLSNNNIGAIDSLAEALKTNLALKEINFQSCTIWDHNKSLAEMLTINSTLQQMNFEFTSMGFEVEQAMILALDSNYSLLKLTLPAVHYYSKYNTVLTTKALFEQKKRKF